MAQGRWWMFPLRIQVENVGKRYGGRLVLAGVSVELAAGQCLLVCGANGSGKSTFLRVLATLVPPTYGRVLYDGRPLADWGPEVRQRIGALFHESLLYDGLTAEENLAWHARLYQVDNPRAAVAEALERVGMRAFGKELVGRFSRGMKQRLSLARALLPGPDLLLLDEPYEGLDRRALARLQGQLESLRAEGKTMVVVAHQWERVWPLADQVLYLEAGRVGAYGGREAVAQVVEKGLAPGAGGGL